MGFRFRKSLKLFPGVRLNLGTRGVSTSLGAPGATVNIGRRGARATLGLPGTGLSYTTGLLGRARGTAPSSAPAAPASAGAALLGWIVVFAMLLLVGSCLGGLRSTDSAAAPAQPLTVSAPATRTVTGDRVNCRANPVNGTVLAKLDRGKVLPVIAQEQGWTKLAHLGGDCWISDTLLR